jgi:gas vesicle protein
MTINSKAPKGRPIMADQTFRTTDRGSSSASSGFEGTQSAKDQALSAGRELKDKAKEMAGSSTDAIKEQASGLMDTAKDVAAQATDKLQQAVDGQKNAGAEYVGSLADTMRRAAREFDTDLPIAGTYIRKAASQVEVVSDSIRNGNFADLMQGAQSFARRQPTAFLGMAVLAGFGLVRFLKSSAEASNDRGSAWSGTNQPDWSGTDNLDSNLNTMRRTNVGQQGYRDEFTK